jgi:hypothetical protein
MAVSPRDSSTSWGSLVRAQYRPPPGKPRSGGVFDIPVGNGATDARGLVATEWQHACADPRAAAVGRTSTRSGVAAAVDSARADDHEARGGRSTTGLRHLVHHHHHHHLRRYRARQDRLREATPAIRTGRTPYVRPGDRLSGDRPGSGRSVPLGPRLGRGPPGLPIAASKNSSSGPRDHQSDYPARAGTQPAASPRCSRSPTLASRQQRAGEARGTRGGLPVKR